MDDGSKYFHVPSDNDLNMSDNDRINYLNSVVSNMRENDGDIIESGSVILSFDKIVNMINDGYTILEFEYFNSDLVSVKYIKVNKNNGRKVR